LSYDIEAVLSSIHHGLQQLDKLDASLSAG